ncbi:zinc finger and SCAN domain-containing protein 2 isoform X1 [Hippoglossus stenolepis]|uniref:zinc finger and SCAN domain-containing protein 2 isoform X1 n=1 Tax=Hippoglossus stenolepis TaxID=195615 RepID=UPI00159C98DA|nr:zinc finger and SCAN domain-containing protein 2 isoform X1 [Hippoglossus stenolepis]
MEACVNLHSQLASVMEVLANAAVAEICQLVDDGFASLRLEISRSRRENLALKSRLRLMEVRAGGSSHTEPLSSMVVTCARRDHRFEEDGSNITKRDVGSSTQENTDCQQSQPVDGTDQQLEPEAAVVKKERLEEATVCCVLEDHETAANSSIGSQSLSHAAENRDSGSAQFEKQDLVGLEAQQEEEQEETSPYTHLESHRAAPGCPNRDLTKEDKHVVDLRDFTSTDPNVHTPLIKKLVSELPLNTSMCGAAADWTEAVMSTPVKLEAFWSEAFRTCDASVSVTRSQCVNNSRLTYSHQTDRQEASLDDLFSTTEVARSLTTPHKHSTDGVVGTDESLSTRCFPVLSSGSSFGNSSMSDWLTGPSFSKASADSRSTSFPSSTEQAFSCQQCSRLFSTSRDLVVHQRSHSGERIFHCHLCTKPFVHPHQLKTHQRVHTGEKPFSCAQCGKRFSQSSHIKRHMSVHTGEKRYSCSLCGKRFSQACSLKVHQAVHTGERPYSCSKCGKSFSVLGNLVRHQSLHVHI